MADNTAEREANFPASPLIEAAEPCPDGTATVGVFSRSPTGCGGLDDDRHACYHAIANGPAWPEASCPPGLAAGRDRVYLQ